MVWDPKDPWTQKNDPLEEALRQAKSHLRGFKGFRPIVLAVVAILFVWQSAFIVAPDEEGVVRRFGEVVRSAGPGPHMKIPFIETVVRPKVEKLHRVEIGFRTDQQGRQHMLPKEALMLTGDENIIGIEFIIQYKIKTAKDYLFLVDEIDETIQKAAEASMREVGPDKHNDEALTSGKAQIQQDTQTLLQTILDSYQAGVQIAAWELQDVDPPEAVVAAFKMWQREKDRVRNSSINRKAIRDDIIPKAKGEAAQVVNQAKGYAQAASLGRREKPIDF